MSALPLPYRNTHHPPWGCVGTGIVCCLFYFLQKKPQCPEQGLSRAQCQYVLVESMRSRYLRVQCPCWSPPHSLPHPWPVALGLVVLESSRVVGPRQCHRTTPEMETVSGCVRPALVSQRAWPAGLPSVSCAGKPGWGKTHAPLYSSRPGFLCGDAQNWPHLDKH